MKANRNIVTKTLSLLLACSLVLSFMPLMPAYAQDNQTKLQAGALPKDDTQFLTLQSQGVPNQESLQALSTQSDLQGQGTFEDPYLISNAIELNSIRNNLSAEYKLIADIDLSGYSWTPIGNQENAFSGALYGNGKTISNLTIDGHDLKYAGLFGLCNNAVFEEVALKNATVSNDTSGIDFTQLWLVDNLWNDTYVYFGALAGANGGDDARMENCSVSGMVKLVNCNSAYVGGLTGMSRWIVDCTNSADVTVVSNRDSRYENDGTVHCGGIVGEPPAINSAVWSCVNNGSITASAGGSVSVGGISGSYGSIWGCNNLGTVTGTTTHSPHGYSSYGTHCMVGGIVGDTDSESTCYSVNSGRVYGRANFGGGCTVGGITGYLGFYSSGHLSYCVNLGNTIQSIRQEKVDDVWKDTYATAARIVGTKAGWGKGIDGCISLNTTVVNGALAGEEQTEDGKNGLSLTTNEVFDKSKGIYSIKNVRDAKITWNGLDIEGLSLGDKDDGVYVYNGNITLDTSKFKVVVSGYDGAEEADFSNLYYTIKATGNENEYLLRVYGPAAGRYKYENCCYGLKSSIIRIEPSTSGDLSDAEIRLDGKTLDEFRYVWTGQLATPKVSVYAKPNGFPLPGLLSDSQYSVEYSNNARPGTASVTIKGKDRWTGTASCSFEILKTGWDIRSDMYRFDNPSSTVDKKYCYKLFGPVQGESIFQGETKNHGLCFGMVATAISSSVYSKPSASSYRSASGESASSIYGIGSSWSSSHYGISALDLIKCGWVSQKDKSIQDERDTNWKRFQANPKSLYDDVVNSLNHGGQPISIGVWGSNYAKTDTWGHELWAIGVGIHDLNKTEIIIYDCNYPSETKTLTLLKDGNGNYTGKWQYPIFDNLNWGSAYNDSRAAIKWCTSGDFVDEVMQRNADANSSDNSNFISVDSSVATLTYNDIKVSSSSYENGTIDGLSRIDNTSAADPSNYSFWSTDARKIGFSDLTNDSHIAVSSKDCGLKIHASSGATVDVINPGTSTNSAEIHQAEGSRFEISFLEESVDASLDELDVSGTGSRVIRAKKSNDEFEITGITELIIRNDEGLSTRVKNLDDDITYTVLPGDENNKPEVIADAQGDPLFQQKAVAVGAGGGHTGAVLEDGSLWMWGQNGNGQIGDGTYEDRVVPGKILDDVKVISLGAEHSAALKTDGSLWMWGRNKYGQLGDGTTETKATPIKIMDGVKSVSLGASSTAVIKNDGSLWVWGYNGQDDLGIGEPESIYDCRTSPVKLATGVRSVSMGSHTGGYIDIDGKLWTWGANALYGSVGNGTNENVATPVNILDNVTTIEMGTSSAAIKHDGSLWMWGYNGNGQLGNGTNVNKNSPTKIADNVSSVSLGFDFTIAKVNGALKACGSNRYGQLGINSNDYSVNTLSGDVANILLQDAGDYHGVAINKEGNVCTWGRNNHGQLGNGTNVNSSAIATITSGGSSLIAPSSLVDIATASVTNIDSATYTGDSITQSPLVKLGDIQLDQDWDYEVAYSNNINAGTAVMTITGKGVYEGRLNSSFAINAAPINTANVAKISDSVYSGKAQEPEVFMSMAHSELLKGEDYTVTYSNNINAGTATVAVTGKGNYTGTKSATFKIGAADLSGATISGLSSMTYTGKAIVQNPSVKLGDKILASGTDYTVSYKDNVNIGTATAIVTGKGNYTGSKSATFKINAASGTPATSDNSSTSALLKVNLSKAAITNIKAKAFTGKAVTQSPVVKIGGKTLKSGTDYSLSYKNNVKVGTATVTVTGKGNYTGSKSATFKINKANQPMTAKAVNKTVKLKNVKKKAVALKKPVTVKKSQGKVTYKNVSKAKNLKKFKVNAKNGTITVPKGTKKGAYKVKIKVTAKGNANYASGSKTVTVKVTVK